jgi:hypothetical protein
VTRSSVDERWIQNERGKNAPTGRGNVASMDETVTPVPRNVRPQHQVLLSNQEKTCIKSRIFLGGKDRPLGFLWLCHVQSRRDSSVRVAIMKDDDRIFVSYYVMAKIFQTRHVVLRHLIFRKGRP